MLRMFSMSFLGCLLFASTHPVFAESAAQHIVIISVDGFRPDFYRDERWPAPTIQSMAAEGVHAERVRSVFPTVTYPSHTTIMTGMLPARHGIYYNTPFEEGGQTGRWYWEEKSILVPTLWDAVRDAGGKTAGVSWPVTVGAPQDWGIPEVWSLDPKGDRLAPMREGTTPPGLWEEIQREATGALDMRTYSANYIGRDDETGAAAAYILETYKPNLLALHLVASDHFQHAVGREGTIVRQSVAASDNAIRMIVEAADRGGILEQTAFIVTGDHGFVDIHTTVAPNVWLVKAGLMAPQKDRGDWRASFHGAGGSIFLHLRNPNDTEAVEQVQAILDDLPLRTRKLFRVLDAEAMAKSGGNPNVPLALAAKLGVTFTDTSIGLDTGPAKGGTHGYFPTDFPEIYTGFVGWGAGFAKGVTVHEMGLEDIAPLVARLLGIPFPECDGTAPLGVVAAK